jgi:hypothetical protein
LQADSASAATRKRAAGSAIPAAFALPESEAVPFVTCTRGVFMHRASPFSASLALWAAFALANVSTAAAAFKYWDVTDTAKTPRTLTATGAFSSVPAGKLIADAHPYEVNSPLWSDDAHKTRWVLLPPGKSVAFSDTVDYWGYPDSAVFIKEFDIDTIPGDSTTRRRWETRFLINKREITDSATRAYLDHWYGFSYKWNAAQTEGNWVGQYSVNDSIRTFPKGKGTAVKMKKWAFPAQECRGCHTSAQDDTNRTTHTRSVLGFFTAQLNRPMLGKPSVNQLDSLFKVGVLVGVKPATWANSPRWRAIDDSTASVNVRARSYLAANCSGCHGIRGNINSVAGECRPVFDYHTMNDSLWDPRHRSSGSYLGMEDSLPKFYPVTDLGNNPLGLDSFAINSELLVPGYPQKSALIMRQRVRDTVPGDYNTLREQMPPYGSYEINQPAIALLSRWVREIPVKMAPGALAIYARGGSHAGAGLVFKGDRILMVPEGTAAGSVSMSGLDGRTIALRPLGGNAYAVPASVPSGTYFIRIGKQGYKRQLP